MSPLVPAFRQVLGDQLRVLVVHRHPLSVAASHTAMGMYSRFRDRSYCLDPWHQGARHPQFRDRWPRMTPLEKNLFRWLEITTYGLEIGAELPDTPVHVLPADQLFDSTDALAAVVEFTGFASEHGVTPSRERNGLAPGSNESRPIRDEWRRIHDHPEIVELAASLGYDLADEVLERLVEKYRLPAGFLPALRNRTRYWDLRWLAGSVLRRAGVRPALYQDRLLASQRRGRLHV